MAPVAATNNTINDQIEEIEREKLSTVVCSHPGTNLPSAAELASFVAQETASAQGSEMNNDLIADYWTAPVSPTGGNRLKTKARSLETLLQIILAMKQLHLVDL